VLTDELLSALGPHLGGPVSFAESPVRLGGGYFTENYAFSLAEAPAPWDVPLVVRLFPSSAPPDLAHREAAVQGVLVDQGYPAPRVLFFGADARLLDRPFFVMERLPGRALLGGIGLRAVAGSGWGLLRRLPEVTATLQAQLHRLDSEPLVAELADTPAGIERWFAALEESVASGAAGLADGLAWLVEHRPTPRAPVAICHGDLWAGNILVEAGRVTGVIDWSVATVAEPALDVGFTAMALSLAPIDAPPPIQRGVARLAGWLCRRYVRAYGRETGADLSSQPYYEALRCAAELTGVAAYRLAAAKGEPHDAPRPIWDSIADAMLDYFDERTGVRLALPAPAS